MKLEDITFTVRESLVQANVPAEAIKQVLADLEKAAEEEKAARKPKSKSKKQWVILAMDKEGQYKHVETVAFAFQIEENAAPQCILDRIHAAANSFNGTRKGRKHPVKTIGATCEAVGGKHWKSGNPTEKTSVKTRTAVPVQFVENNLKQG
jgi:hypothetical protein